MDEVKRFQKLIALANQWLADSATYHAFMPDDEGDKIARTRTEACARQLLRVLAEQEQP